MDAVTVIQTLLGSSTPVHPTLEQAKIIYKETGMCWWPNIWCANGQVGTREMFDRVDGFIVRVNAIAPRGKK